MPKKPVSHGLVVQNKSRPIYPQAVQVATLRKALEDQTGVGASRKGTSPGRRWHPFDMRAVKLFKPANVHHSTCIEAKTSSMVGVGFKKGAKKGGLSKVEKVLAPFCNVSFMHVLWAVVEDFNLTANGYMEVVRQGKRTTGLHHLPSENVFVVVDNPLTHDFHYELDCEKGTIPFARFGDAEGLKERLKLEADVSEIIHFYKPSSINPHYGVPAHLAAAPSIEIVQMNHQYIYDFFANRGVPEFLLFLLGNGVTEADFNKLKALLNAGVGVSKSHKSGAFHFSNPELKVQAVKLGLESGSGTDGLSFAALNDALSLEIVSAHQVPPLLAGIQIPGKLGSNNELPNALMSFQTLVIGPAQKLFENTFNNTLGNKAISGVRGLSAGDFEFKSVLDSIDLGMADTVGRMRQTVPEAKAQGRDLKAGVKKEDVRALKKEQRRIRQQLWKEWNEVRVARGLPAKKKGERSVDYLIRVLTKVAA